MLCSLWFELQNLNFRRQGKVEVSRSLIRRSLANTLRCFYFDFLYFAGYYTAGILYTHWVITPIYSSLWTHHRNFFAPFPTWVTTHFVPRLNQDFDTRCVCFFVSFRLLKTQNPSSGPSLCIS